MKMHKASHPRDDSDRLYVSRKEEEGGVASIEESIDATIRLEDNIKKAWKKTNYKHEDQNNKNTQKTKMGRKTAVILQTTNKPNFTWEN